MEIVCEYDNVCLVNLKTIPCNSDAEYIFVLLFYGLVTFHGESPILSVLVILELYKHRHLYHTFSVNS